MKTLRSSRILALLLLVSAAFIGANAANQNSGAAQPAAKGAYTVTFHVNMPTTVPDGATISCKASIAPQPTVFEHFTRRHTATAQSTTGFANVANNSATCTVAAPFAFNAGNSSVWALMLTSWVSDLGFYRGRNSTAGAFRAG